MKYIVILGDGMADLPNEQLGGRTPLEVAKKPNIDSLAQKGICGMVKTVPDSLKPGSDVANLSVMGYSPLKYYTGRSPLEALSIGVDMADDDLAIRCNLVTLSDEENYADKTMVDYSAGEISTEEAAELIKAVQQGLGNEKYHFYNGVSYRHCLIIHHSEVGTQFTPPHDISGKVVGDYLPSGLNASAALELMMASWDILKDHPVNKKRIAEGKNPANSIWLWGEGSKPMLPSFEKLRGMKGAVISAVDLLKGIGIAGGMEVVEVEGATGTVKTNFDGKAKACVDAIKNGCDYVYLHMEAPDECGHQGDIEGKVKSIELIDEKVVGYILKELENEHLRILIAPDHPTPIITKTHARDPVPFVVYDSAKSFDGVATYTEKFCKQTGLMLASGDELVSLFLEKGDNVDEVKDAEVEDEAKENLSSGSLNMQELNEENAIILDAVFDENGEVKAQENSENPLKIAPNEQNEVENSNEQSQMQIAQGEEMQEQPQTENSLKSEAIVEGKNNNKKAKNKKVKKSAKPLEAENTAQNGKKKMSKKNKVIAIVASVLVAIMIITASILTPVLIVNAPKVFVGKAEDFSKQITEKKEYYVLNRDITYDGNLTIGLDMDINDKVLTVNGTLTFEKGKNGSLAVGSRKKNVYELGGKIVAQKVVFSSYKDMLLATNVVAEQVVFKNIAKTQIIGSVQANNQLQVNDSNIEFSNVAFGSNVNQVHLSNSMVTFLKPVNCNLKQENSKVIAKADIKNAELDENSEIRVYGKVLSDFDSNKLGWIKGGKLVYISENSSFDYVEGAQIVWLDKNNNGNGNCLDCGEIKYIKWLETPDAAKFEKIGTSIWLNLINVDSAAQKVLFTIDGADVPIEEDVKENTSGDGRETRFNLTQYLNKVGEHNIKIVLISNEREFVRDSEPYFLKYVHIVTLQEVSEAKVTLNSENKYVLSFKTVDLADSYEVSLDGVKFTLEANRADDNGIINEILSDREEVKQLLTPGNHLITIVSMAKKDANIKASEKAIANFPTIMGELKTPELNYTISEDGQAVIFAWNKVENAVRYELYFVGENGEKMLVNTLKHTFTLTFDDKYNIGDSFYLKAVGDDFYNDKASERIEIAQA